MICWDSGIVFFNLKGVDLEGVRLGFYRFELSLVTFLGSFFCVVVVVLGFMRLF